MRKKLVIFLSLFLTIIILAPPLALAAKYVSGDKSVILPKNETVNGNYFAASGTVTLSGIVNGDAYVAGGTVIVDGTVNGDLLAAGGSITITGTVRDDIRVAGGQVTISGDVGRNVTAAGGQVTIIDGADVRGSLVAGMGNLTVLAPIGSEVAVGGGQVTIGNRVGGDVVAGVGQLFLTPNASISGDLTYYSDKKADISKGASVSGTISQKASSREARAGVKEKDVKEAAGKLYIFAKIAKFLAALVIAFLLIRLAPVFTKKAADVVENRTLASLGIGFLTLVVVPIAAVVLLLTLIGIPLGLMIIALLAVAGYFAKYFVAVVIGEKALRFFNSTPSLGKNILLGLIILELIDFVPIVGGLVGVIVFLIGLGALVIGKRDLYRQLRDKKLI